MRREFRTREELELEENLEEDSQYNDDIDDIQKALKEAIEESFDNMSDALGAMSSAFSDMLHSETNAERRENEIVFRNYRSQVRALSDSFNSMFEVIRNNIDETTVESLDSLYQAQREQEDLLNSYYNNIVNQNGQSFSEEGYNEDIIRELSTDALGMFNNMEYSVESLGESFEQLMNSQSKIERRWRETEFAYQINQARNLQENFDNMFNSIREFMSDEEVELMEEFYEEQKKQLDLYNRYYEHEVLNNRRDLQRLFNDVEDGVLDLSNAFGSITDIYNALQLNRITDALTSGSEQNIDVMSEVSRIRGLTYKEVKTWKNELEKEDTYGGHISASEIMSVYRMNGVSKDYLENIDSYLALFMKETETTNDQLQSLLWWAEKSGKSEEEVKTIMDELSFTRLVDGVDSSEITSKLNEMIINLDPKRIKDYIAASTAAKALDLDMSFVDDILSGSFDGTISGSDQAKLGMLGAFNDEVSFDELMKAMNDKDYDEFYKLYATAMHDIATSGKYNADSIAMVADQLGVSVDTIKDYGQIDPNAIQDIIDAIDGNSETVESLQETVGRQSKWDMSMNENSTGLAGRFFDTMNEFTSDHPLLTSMGGWVGGHLAMKGISSVGKQIKGAFTGGTGTGGFFDNLASRIFGNHGTDTTDDAVDHVDDVLHHLDDVTDNSTDLLDSLVHSQDDIIHATDDIADEVLDTSNSIINQLSNNSDDIVNNLDDVINSVSDTTDTLTRTTGVLDDTLRGTDDILRAASENVDDAVNAAGKSASAFKSVAKGARVLGGLATAFQVYEGVQEYSEAETGEEKAGIFGKYAGNIAGGWAGGEVGASAGGAVGSFFGPIGTAIGAGVGAIGGAIAGAIIGEDAGEVLGGAVHDVWEWGKGDNSDASKAYHNENVQVYYDEWKSANSELYNDLSEQIAKGIEEGNLDISILDGIDAEAAILMLEDYLGQLSGKDWVYEWSGDARVVWGDEGTSDVFGELINDVVSSGTAERVKLSDTLSEDIVLPVDGSHANGLDSVPYDGYIAELHKGERVLTASEAISQDEAYGFSSEICEAVVEIGSLVESMMQVLEDGFEYLGKKLDNVQINVNTIQKQTRESHTSRVYTRG